MPASGANSNRAALVFAIGEHAHNWVVSKQLLQASAIHIVRIDSCRLAGVSEVLAVLHMAAKFGLPVCPHAGVWDYARMSPEVSVTVKKESDCGLIKTQA